MRKKSAFLERLTARAAAAFEAGSFGASDEQEFAQNIPAFESPNSLNAPNSTTSSDAPELRPQAEPTGVTESAGSTELDTTANLTGPTEPAQSPQVSASIALHEQTAVYAAPTSGTHAELAKPMASPIASPAEAPVPVLAPAVEPVTAPIKTPKADHAPSATPPALPDEAPILSAEPSFEPSPESNFDPALTLRPITPDSQKPKKTLPTAKSPEDDEERICASLGLVAKLLFAHMIGMEKKVLNMKKVCLYNQNNEPIPYPSIRTAWGRLKDLGIVAKSARHDVGKEKGVLFQLDGRYTFAFQKLYPQTLGQAEPTALAFQPLQHAIQQSLLHVAAPQPFSPELQSLPPVVSSSPTGSISPSLSTVSTGSTSSPVAPAISSEPSKPKTKLEVHPEYHFWREYGLTQTQCARWKEEFGLDDLLLDNFLRWCAHDLGQGDRKDKSGKHISNPANWFYSLLKKTGAYPRPEGYQSHEEKTVLMRESALKEQSALQARQDALRVEEEKAEAEALFIAFLEEGERSPHFNELCQKVSPFLYQNRHTRRRLFESALRAEYFKFLGLG